MQRPLTTIAALVLFAAPGCDNPSDVKGLAGTYVMAMWGATDTLWLRADGRYVRTLRDRHDSVTTDSGGWFVASRGTAVGLRDYPKRIPFVHDLQSDPKGLKLREPHIVSLTVGRNWKGRLRLEWYPGFGWSYERAR